MRKEQDVLRFHHRSQNILMLFMLVIASFLVACEPSTKPTLPTPQGHINCPNPTPPPNPGPAKLLVYARIDPSSSRSLISAVSPSDGGILWHYQTNGVVRSLEIESGVLYIRLNSAGSPSYDDTLVAVRTSNGSTLWRYHITNGTIKGGLTVEYGLVYLQLTDVLGTHALNTGPLYVLRASDGRVLWHHDTDGQMQLLAIDNRVVYGHEFSGTAQKHTSTLYALRAADGGVLWHYQSDHPIRGLLACAGAVYVSTADVSDNGSAGSVYALQANTGSLLWHTQIGNQAFGSLAAADGVIYAESEAYNIHQETSTMSLYVLRPADGIALWHAQFSQLEAFPLVSNGVIYFSAKDSPSAAPSVYARRLSDGKVLWQHQDMNSQDFLMEANGIIYIAGSVRNTGDAGIVSALRANDGTSVWSVKTGYGPYLVLDHEKVYIASPVKQDSLYTGMLSVVQVGNGAAIWHAQIGYLVGFMQVINGVLYVDSGNYVGTAFALCAWQASNGTQLWCDKGGYDVQVVF